MNQLHRRGRVAVAVGAVAALAVTSAGAAHATITTTVDGVAFASAMSSVPVTGGLFAQNYVCEADDPTTPDYDETECPTAVSDTPMAGFPTNGTTYSILTNGNAALADNPNTSSGSGKSWGVTSPTMGSTVYDWQTARIDLGPAGGTCLAFDFRFLSEEYPEYVSAGFNDAFVAQLNTLAVTVDPNQGVVAPGNFAAGAGDQISVDASGPSAMTAELAAGTTYDGATLPLVARTPVVAGSTNTLYLTIFDQGDGILDSAVFLDGLRYENLPAGQCKSLAEDPYEGNTGTTVGKPALSGTNYNVPVSCDLPPGPIGCNITVAASVSGPVGRTLPRGSAAAGKTVAIGSATVSVPAGSSQTVALPVSKEFKKWAKKAKAAPKTIAKKAKKLKKKAAGLSGKQKDKLLKKAKKLVKKAKKLKKKPLGKVSITITNSSNGAASITKVDLPRKK